LIHGGYFVKRVESTPESLNAPGVAEICSVSDCISKAPTGWIELWLHNELGWFNRISDAMKLMPTEAPSAYRLFAYRLCPERFRNGIAAQVVVPADVRPDPIPEGFQSLGFDAVSKSMESMLGFECSPLSCNSMASDIRANTHCLFASLEEAIAGATQFSIEQPEPGDYYVVEVLAQRAAFSP
jgi:hypothetical protein